MQFAHEFECPSCGGPVKQARPDSRSLVCGYCGQTSHLNAESLEAAGEKHLLIDYGSVFSLGQYAKLDGQEFMVLGRIRLDYEDGFWDEWYVQYLDDGTTGWIQEDDGQFMLYSREKEIDSPPVLDNIPVGDYVQLDADWPPVFVTSKSKASVQGGEGELPFRIVPGEPADFVDGIYEGKAVSVELLPDEKVLFSGRPFDLKELTLS